MLYVIAGNPIVRNAGLCRVYKAKYSHYLIRLALMGVSEQLLYNESRSSIDRYGAALNS